MAFETVFASEIQLSAIKPMICRRFSSFRFRFLCFMVVLSGSSAFIEAIGSNTKYLQDGYAKLYYVCRFKISNKAFFKVLSIGYCVITTHRPSLRPPSRTKIPLDCITSKSRLIVLMVTPVFCDISRMVVDAFSIIISKIML